MNKFDELSDLVSEEYIKNVSRTFHPRNFELSPEFKAAYKKEFTRLRKTNKTPREIYAKICKSLLFVK